MKNNAFKFMAAAVMAACLVSCGNGSAKKTDSKKLSVVTTIFPEYDWVKNIVGENSDRVEVTLLLDKGVDLHSFQPTVEDIMKISNCDIFVYVGGESDEWVEDVIENSVNKNLKAVNLMEVLGDKVKEEILVEGMEHEHHHDGHEAHEHHHDEDHDGHEAHEHNHDEDHDGHEAHEHHHHDEVENDEHVWLSLKFAPVIVNAICDQLCLADPLAADIYRKNADEYCRKLHDLDFEFEKMVSGKTQKTILLADRFPFRYLADDYGIDYYAAFSGCSAESEAGFETIAFLSKKVDELKLPAVLKIEKSSPKIAETVIGNTASKKAVILELDSLQSSTLKDRTAGVTYLSAMKKNLDVLSEAMR